jgi:hypothetical protein
LPKGYAEALGTLEVSLIIILQTRVNEIRQLLPWLRGFEDCYVMGKWLPEHTGYEMEAKSFNGERVFNKDLLWWCLEQLTVNPEDVYSIDAATILGFFDDLVGIRQSNIDCTRIERRLIDELSDLGSIWELLMAVRYHRPLCEVLTKEKAMDVGGDRVC